MDGRDSNFSESQRAEYFEKEILKLFILSYIAAAASCAEIYPHVEEIDVEALAKLTIFWEELREISLAGKAFWELHGQHRLAQFDVGIGNG
jgi:hypothetical protein